MTAVAPGSSQATGRALAKAVAPDRQRLPAEYPGAGPRCMQTVSDVVRSADVQSS